jgi:hypothetical protein
MITNRTLRALLMSAANAALLGLAPGLGCSAWAANPAAARPPSASSGMPGEQRALDEIAQARAAAQHRQARNTVEQTERAETALLNLQQLHPDTRFDRALKQLDSARAAIGRGDTRAADAQLAAATGDLGVASGSSLPPANR